jgi:hypothetical protein
MHAVVFDVNIGIDPDEAANFLRENIVPRVKEAPGFIAGYWVRLSSNEGRSVVVFDSEAAAQAALEQGPQPPEGVTIERSEVGEVVASA